MAKKSIRKASRKNDRKGKHLPSVEFTLVHPVDGRIFLLRNDIGHRKVSVFMGKTPETLTVPQDGVRYFEDRDSLREYVDFRLDAAEAAGFVAI